MYQVIESIEFIGFVGSLSYLSLLGLLGLLSLLGSLGPGEIAKASHPVRFCYPSEISFRFHGLILFGRI